MQDQDLPALRLPPGTFHAPAHLLEDRLAFWRGAGATLGPLLLWLSLTPEWIFGVIRAVGYRPLWNPYGMLLTTLQVAAPVLLLLPLLARWVVAREDRPEARELAARGAVSATAVTVGGAGLVAASAAGSELLLPFLATGWMLTAAVDSFVGGVALGPRTRRALRVAAPLLLPVAALHGVGVALGGTWGSLVEWLVGLATPAYAWSSDIPHYLWGLHWYLRRVLGVAALAVVLAPVSALVAGTLRTLVPELDRRWVVGACGLGLVLLLQDYRLLTLLSELMPAALLNPQMGLALPAFTTVVSLAIALPHACAAYVGLQLADRRPEALRPLPPAQGLPALAGAAPPALPGPEAAQQPA